MRAVSALRASSRFDGRDAIPLFLMVVIWTSVVVWAPSQSHRGDVLRFHDIAHGGTPYVDQQIEYPPLETALVFVVGASSISGTALILAVVNGLATVGCWRVLRAGWSPEVARIFLWFALPLQVFMPFRLDAVSVLLALAGIVVAERNRETAGGSLLGAGVLFKLWPIVVLPIFLVRRRPRAVLVALAMIVGGVIVWALVFGLDALGQVGSYRGATGWQIESVFGAIVRVTTADPVRLEAGALRIGQASDVDLWWLRAATLLLVALAWIPAGRRPVDPAGGPALASVAVLLILSPVASPQYVMWLLPWAAVTAAERRPRDVRILTIGAAITASAVFVIYWGDPRQVTMLVILALGRAACIGGLAVVGFVHREITRLRPNPRRLEPALLV